MSFIEGIFFLRPVSGSSLKTMIFASWPPSSITDPAAGWTFSTARHTAFTSCTNFAPMRGDMFMPPLPVMKARTPSLARGRGEAVDLVIDALQELEDLLGLPGLVALVVLPQDTVGPAVDHDRLDGGRADIETDEESGVHRHSNSASSTS